MEKVRYCTTYEYICPNEMSPFSRRTVRFLVVAFFLIAASSAKPSHENISTTSAREIDVENFRQNVSTVLDQRQIAHLLLGACTPQDKIRWVFYLCVLLYRIGIVFLSRKWCWRRRDIGEGVIVRRCFLLSFLSGCALLLGVYMFTLSGASLYSYAEGSRQSRHSAVKYHYLRW